MGLEELYNKLLSEYKKRTPKSQELYDKARSLLPMGVTYHIRFFDPYPFYVIKAKGSKVYDVDGNEYTDYWMGHGALILGHANEQVRSKVKEQLDKGSHWGFEHEYALKLAEKIIKHVPSIEMIRFTNSGTEANMYAIRLVRAYTGRRKIVKFEGGWHGGYDQLHVAVKPGTWLGSAGLPKEAVAHTLVVEFNNVDELEKTFREHGNDIAGVIMEPVQGAAGVIPAEQEFIERVRELCDEYGSLLIFDEVITGFRLGLGGAQEYYGVRADVVVFGKIIGGGFPIGAFASTKEVMEALDYTKTPKEKRSFHGGTFAGNPISMIAGYATLEILEKPGFYDYLNWLSGKLASELDDIGQRFKVPVSITSAGSMIGIHFMKDKPRNVREVHENKVHPLINKVFHKYMLLKGIVFLTEDTSHLLLASTHTLEDANEFLEAFEEFLKTVERLVGEKLS